MGAPVSGLEPAGEKTAEALLAAFRHIAAGERRRHATVFNYWLSIQRGRELPPIRDLDPLEISDVAPSSVLLELIAGGEDAEIRHAGEMLGGAAQVKRLSEAPTPSVLSCIAGKLGIIAISRDALAFEETFESDDGKSRVGVTLLPFSTSGDVVDFVYALVSLDTGVTEVEETPEPAAEAQAEPVEDGPREIETAESVPDAAESVPEVLEVPEPPVEEPHLDPAAEPEPVATPAAGKPALSKVFDALAGATGFFGTVASWDGDPEPVADESMTGDEPPPAAEEPESVANEAAEQPAPVAEEPTPVTEEPAPMAAENTQPTHAEPEGTLQSKLTEVRSKADEARTAKLRAEAVLAEGLSAAYDFALDAENAPEEYLKLVEQQGLKIQLRSPMKPVVKLAFAETCDDATIGQLETVLSWALKLDLPRGTLAQRIEEEGGLSAVLSGQKRAA
ncbi:MAG: hypothetical protein ACJ8D5_02355 [Sphingomicrobium sp.]